MKLIGILLFLASALGSVLALSLLERRRTRELEALSSLLCAIQSGMLRHRLPLCEIYAAFENDALAACGFLEDLRKDGLAYALRADTLAIREEELSFLFTYAEDLGKRFLEEEREAAENALAALAARREEHRTEGAKKGKIQRTLLITGAGMLLLLLL